MIEKGSYKYLNLNLVKYLILKIIILINYLKLIKFNNTTFNLSNLKGKTTTYKLQRIEIQNFNSLFKNIFGENKRYALYLCNLILKNLL